MPVPRRIAVVGAGLAGLSAARTLVAAGHEVVVLDKGRGPGGRLATRRIGAATLDHGAQFFTVRSDEFAAVVHRWRDDGVIGEWCRGFTEAPDGFVRYYAPGGMNSLAKHLARGLDVRCNSLVFSILPGSSPSSPAAWSVKLDDASTIDVDAVIVTCPLPQAYSLLVTADVELPETLLRTDYDRTLALLAVLDRPSRVPAPGGVQGADGFTFIADNQQKGVSAVPALTLHADPAWSAAHWDDDRAVALEALVTAAGPWLGDAQIVDRQLKRWRFATPQATWPERCWQADGPHPLILAGDAFDGPRIEGAVRSGLAAGRALLGATASGTLAG